MSPADLGYGVYDAEVVARDPRLPPHANSGFAYLDESGPDAIRQAVRERGASAHGAARPLVEHAGTSAIDYFERGSRVHIP